MENRLKQIRIQKKISQYKLADLANTTPQHIGRLENGTCKLTLQWLERLAKALDVSPNELINDNQKTPSEEKILNQDLKNNIYDLIANVVYCIDCFINDNNINLKSERKAQITAGLVIKLLDTPKEKHTDTIKNVLDWEGTQRSVV